MISVSDQNPVLVKIILSVSENYPIYIIISTAAFLQRNENTVMVNIAVINCAKKKKISNLN